MDKFYFNLVSRIIENGKKNGNLDRAHVEQVINVYFAGGYITLEQYQELMAKLEA